MEQIVETDDLQQKLKEYNKKSNDIEQSLARLAEIQNWWKQCNSKKFTLKDTWHSLDNIFYGLKKCHTHIPAILEYINSLINIIKSVLEEEGEKTHFFDCDTHLFG